jgi:hypothetical protein
VISQAADPRAKNTRECMICRSPLMWEFPHKDDRLYATVRLVTKV